MSSRPLALERFVWERIDRIYTLLALCFALLSVVMYAASCAAEDKAISLDADPPCMCQEHS